MAAEPDRVAVVIEDDADIRNLLAAILDQTDGIAAPVLKATGDGLSTPMSDLTVGPAGVELRSYWCPHCQPLRTVA